MTEQKNNPLKYETLHSSVEIEFWYQLEHKKLVEFKLDNSPKKFLGSYHSGGEHQSVSSRFILPGDAFDIKETTIETCYSPGVIYNANTKEEFQNFDKYNLLKDSAKSILKNIESKEWLKNPSVLTEFLLLSYADLKHHKFWYWFGFPSIITESIQMTPAESITKIFDEKIIDNLKKSYGEYRKKVDIYQRGFFLVSTKDGSVHSLESLKDFKTNEFFISFLDPSSLNSYPGWFLRNYIIASSLTFGLKKFKILCYREIISKSDISTSITFDIEIVDKLLPSEFKCVGWEKNSNNKNSSRSIDVGFMMDPIKLAESSVALNLNLMKWRMFPSLDVDLLGQQKCLLVGSGTLGCQVARNLIAWSIFNITFLDNSKVSYSNPVRQSLYNYEDCLDGGKPKAKCASDNLKKIYPNANSNYVNMNIPMPGYVVTKETRDEIEKNVEQLEKLVKDHDVIFLLTDTRESRWLPSVLGKYHKKLVITVALGFESYVVMRHGMKPNDKSDEELGCYFCNDVVAPVNSTKDRSMDQQCTVARPGTSAMAGALAVELLISLLHHKKGAYANASKLSDEVGDKFGLVPHQLRGSLSTFQTMMLIGSSYSQCTACSNTICEHYKNDGFKFLEKCFNEPEHLEDITGLTKLKQMTDEAMEGIEDEDGFDLL
eukprot:gene10723-3343_t